MRVSYLSRAFAYSLLVTSIASESGVQDCFDACLGTEACANDPHSHSSYCKFWLTKSVCFGLYWRADNTTEMCFYPNDPSCPQTFPVLCNETAVMNTTTIVPTASVRTSIAPSQSSSTTTSTTPISTTTSAIVSTTVTSTVAPSSGVSSTTISSSSTTSGTTTPSVSTTLKPSGLAGRYCGSSDSTNLIGIQLNFTPTTVDITLSDYLNGSISNIPYVYDSSSGLVAITPTPTYVGFLNSLPLFLVPQDIVVVYTAASDQVTITVLGVIIQATHEKCTAL